MKMELAISGTSATTYKMMEPYSKRIQKFGQSYQMKNDILKTLKKRFGQTIFGKTALRQIFNTAGRRCQLWCKF